MSGKRKPLLKFLKTTKNKRFGRFRKNSSVGIKIDQYLEILSSGAYQLLLSDYSVIRYSFVFDGAKLVEQNILWWPCPVHMDAETENEFGLIEGLKQKVNASQKQSDYIMRSPIRIDFDSSNDKPSHPRAHAHIEHYDCRINSGYPICFNRFMKFIILNFYPHENINCEKWSFLNYQYNQIHKKQEYDKTTSLLF